MTYKNYLYVFLIINFISANSLDDYFRAYQADSNALKSIIENSKTKHRIAFVFAGSPRSLIVPPVHESIRENLINSFCPIDYCISDVFVRVSLSDNTHGGLDSLGKLSHGDTNMKPTVKYAILRLNPQINSTHSFTDIDWTDIGSEKEKNEMLTSKYNTTRHKIFRVLDPRRYSMYFNRWSVYKMVLDRENELGKKYDWIVHARLDAMWGEPIRPFYDWSKDNVYCPDTWWSDVPDTFALLPRKWSDGFFDLDSLVAPRAMCLGGPNFDPLFLTEAKLVALKFSPEEINLAKSVDCIKAHNGNIGYAKHPILGDNIPWSDEGYSERILKRKLRLVGISQDKKTLVFHPFFLVVIRYPLDDPLVNFLHPDNHIGFIRTIQTVSFGQFHGCKNMIREMIQLHDLSYLPCKENHKKPCLIEKSISDWNFMPFRVRNKFHRLNLCWDLLKNGTIFLEKCQNYHLHTRSPDINISYSGSQLFHMFPLWKNSQTITNWGIEDSMSENLKCLTTIDTNGMKSLIMSACQPNLFTSSQSFKLSYRKAKKFPDSSFSSKSNLPSVFFVSIKWSPKKSNGIDYCVNLKSYGKHKYLSLQECKLIGKKSVKRSILTSQNQNLFEFILERSFSLGPTVSPLFNFKEKIERPNRKIITLK